MPLRELQHPGLDIDLRYATSDNFTGQRIYDHGMAYLHQDAWLALLRAADWALAQGLRLHVFDAYRPPAAQWRLWQVMPDPRFVADPRVGSMHTRGVAVDLTLADAHGCLLDMGTAFDVMTPESFHGCTTVSPEAQRNRCLLLGLMALAGFVHHPFEWWHYQLPNASDYPLLRDGKEGVALMDGAQTDAQPSPVAPSGTPRSA
ncbi:MAG: D-alanyl-D-alanine dipeptidase [Rhodoferax sp.]